MFHQRDNRRDGCRPRPRRRRPRREGGPAVIVLPRNRHLAAACRAQAVGQSGRRASVDPPCRNSNSVSSNVSPIGSMAVAANWRAAAAASGAGRAWTRSKPSCSAAQDCAASVSSPPAWNSSAAIRPRWRSNHPSGALDALALLDAVGRIRRDVRIVANDLLGRSRRCRTCCCRCASSAARRRGSLHAVEEALSAEQCVIVFPAGEVSRLSLRGIRDGRWQRGFVRFAAQPARRCCRCGWKRATRRCSRRLDPVRRPALRCWRAKCSPPWPPAVAEHRRADAAGQGR